MRLDSKRSTHGWQVRFQKPWRYFGDASYGGCHASLEAAKEYLVATWYPVQIQTARNYNNRTKEHTDGIRLVARREREKKVWYVEASHPISGKSSRRFYIGVSGTLSSERYHAAKRQALKQRALWNEEYPVRLK